MASVVLAVPSGTEGALYNNVEGRAGPPRPGSESELVQRLQPQPRQLREGVERQQRRPLVLRLIHFSSDAIWSEEFCLPSFSSSHRAFYRFHPNRE